MRVIFYQTASYTNTPTFSDGVSLSGGVLTVPTGVTSFTVSYPTSTDNFVDDGETTTLTIDSAVGTGTINDAPVDWDALAAASCPVGTTPIPVNIIQKPSMETYSPCPNLSTATTINNASNWTDTGVTGGQLMVNDPPGCISPRPASSWPTSQNMSSGADGVAWLGIHSLSGTQGEGATNTLSSPIVAGNQYVGHFAATRVTLNPYNNNGKVQFYGVANTTLGTYSSGGMPAGQFEDLYLSDAITSTLNWDRKLFNFNATQSWNHLRVEARPDTGGNAYLYFDDFVLFRCESPPIIDAIDDDFTGTPISYVGGSTTSVVTADTLDGNANPTLGTEVVISTGATAQDGTTTLGSATSGISLNATTGQIEVAAGTAAGSHTYTYEICEVGNLTNCDTAVATVLVLGAAPTAVPSCGADWYSLVDWATDAPAFANPLNSAVSNTVTKSGITTSITVTPPAAGVFQGYSPNYVVDAGGNPIIETGAVDVELTFSQPVDQIRWYWTDFDGNESVTAYGELNGVRVTPSVVDGPQSTVTIIKALNADGSVTFERLPGQGGFTGDEQTAAFIGFDTPVDRIVVSHTTRVFSSDGDLGTVGVGDLQMCAEFGDAPDTAANTSGNNYQTLASDNGPLHIIDTTVAVGLGSVTDNSDSDGFRDGTDDNSDASDDVGDDGVLLGGTTLQGQSLTAGENIALSITPTGSGVLNAWIDWNANGDFTDAGEQIATDADISGGTLSTTVPTGATIGTTYARFRYSSDTGLSPTGAASDGEVEDYAVTVSAQAQPIFSCSPSIYISSAAGNTVASQLSEVDTSGSPFSLTAIGDSSHGHNYNAAGYREQDNYLYGVKLESNHILRIGSDGSVLDLGAATGLPAPADLNSSYDSGDVFPDGFLYVHEVFNHQELYKIDVTTTPPQVVQTINLSQPIWLSDFAYNAVDNKVYGIGDQGEKFMIDPATWTVSTVGTNTSPASYGAAYTDNVGNVYIYKNNPGTFYLVDFGTNGTGTGNMTAVSTAPNVAFNDGASCRGAPPLSSQALSGIIYEDINYGGGAGRDQTTASGVGINGVTVELYDNSGALISSTVTANDGANDGAYSFSSIVGGDYYIRVVNDTVSSTRVGSDGSELAVQTFRTDGTTAVTGEVGGHYPTQSDGSVNPGAATLNDPANGDFTFLGGPMSGPAQSVTPITVAAASVTGVDFGFNFDTIVNTNDSGQGSLGQFILNSNQLTDIPNQGINTGQETSIFMIPDGTGYAGTTAHEALNLTTGGVAMITTSAGLPAITDNNTAIDGSTQFSTSCAAPRNLTIQLDGSGAAVNSGINGLDITGDGALLRGLSVGGFDGHGVELRGDDADIICNHLGLNAAGTAATPNTHRGLFVSGSTDVRIGDGTLGNRNILSGNTTEGLFLNTTKTGVVVDTNYMGTSLDGMTALGNGSHGLFAANIDTVGSQLTIQNNVSSGNSVSGIYVINSDNLALSVENNLLGQAASGTAVLANGGHGLHISGGNTGSSVTTITNNTLSGNTQNGIWLANTTDVTITNNNIGTDTAGTVVGNGGFGIRVLDSATVAIGDSSAGGSNIVAGNGDDGISVFGTSDITITRNSFYANTGLAIDLVSTVNDVTVNDTDDTDTGPNGLLNFPQFSQISLAGGNLVLKGCAPAGATVELFEADTSAGSTSGASEGDNQFGLTQDYGEGEVYLTEWVMPATGTACAMPTDADGNDPIGMLAFSQAIAVSSLASGSSVVLADKLTATATIAGTGTSEFSALSLIMRSSSLKGTVFEDINYGGGDGRDQASASGVGVNGATVELYDGTGTLVTSTTTVNDGTNDGRYEFTDITNGGYYIRIVSDSVTSTRSGSDGTELAVQTFRTDSVTPVTGEVGGHDPALADGTANSGTETLNTTTYALSGGGAVQSLQAVTVASADVTNIDFGFNFDTIVNTNNAGQGSLGQFILNSNLLTDIPNQGINSGQETSIFMIPDGTGYAGTTAHGALNLTTGGVAMIATSAGLPAITDNNTAIDGGTQSSSSCAAPRNLTIQLDGSGTAVNSGINGLDITGDGALLRGLSVGGFDGHGVELLGDDADIICNHLGLNTAGTVATPNAHRGLLVSGSTDVRIGDGTLDNRNILSGNTTEGLFLNTTKTGVVVDTNYMGTSLDGMTALGNGTHGLFAANIDTAGSQLTIQNNVSSGNTVSGVYVINSDNLALIVENNLLGQAASGTAVLPNGGHGLHISNGNTGSSVTTITNNTLSGNTQNGIWLANTTDVTITNNNIGTDTAGTVVGNGGFGIRVLDSATVAIGDGSAGGSNTVAGNGDDGISVFGTSDITITRNSFYANTGLAIDLVSTVNDVTVNETNDTDTGPNGLLNFPQFSQSSLSGGNLVLAGCAPAGATVELFEADTSASSTSGASEGDNQFGLTQDYGEGEVYLAEWVMPATGTACAMLTDADGNNPTGMLAFSQTIAVSSLASGSNVVSGDKLTATATIAGTGTSEFSALSPIRSNDYGDAPGYGDASHGIDNSTYLGSAPDVDSGTITTNGDASDDSDDGVFIDSGLSTSLQGASMNLEDSVTLHIPVTGSGNLYAWVDWNGDGDFADNGEQIANAVAGTDETLTVVVNVPLGATLGTSYARFRFSSDAAAASPTGSASNGEVEDYQVVIADNPTAPTAPALGACSSTWTAGGGGYQSTTSQGVQITATVAALGASSRWSFASNDALNASGVFSDADLNGAPSLSAIYFWDTSPEDGRLADAADDSETGTITFGFNMPVKNPVLHIDRIGGNGGSIAATPQQLTNSSVITPNAANASATFTHLAGTTHFEVTSNTIRRTPNEEQVFGAASAQSGTDSTLFTAMGSVQVNGNYSAFSLDLAGVGVEGAGADGLEFVVCAEPYDYGDAPDSYKTTEAANGAQHAIVNDVYLGSNKPDADSDGQPGTTANGDGTDEDGITAFGTLTSSDRTYRVEVKVNNASSETATLIAWVDFDGNGSFDADEAAIRTVAAGASPSTITLTWSDIPLDIKAGDTYMRVRLTTDTLNNREPSGTKHDGEVEDHPITITSAGVSVSGRVFRDVNVNAVNDSGEVGVTGLPVVLYDTNNDTCVSTRTNGNGDYRFEGVATGNYQVYEASRERVPVPQNCGTEFAKDPGGYRSTTLNALAAFDVSSSDVPGKDFGDVKPPVFEPDNSSQILPGNVLFYAHRFTTPTQGTVSFTSVSGSNVTAGWASLIYRDSNCNGQLDGTEGSAAMSGTRTGTATASTWVSGPVGPVAAGSSVCLINKVYAPSNVAANDRYQQTITANFNYANASGTANAIAGTETLTVTDTTTAKQVQAPALPATPVVEPAPAVVVEVPAQPATPNVPATETTPEVPSTPYIPEVAPVPEQVEVLATPVVPEVGPSRLELRKTVRNIDVAGSVETESVNTAKPGDTLEYRIYYRNTGTGPLDELIINDVVPPYTELVSASVTDCGTLVSDMTCDASPSGLDVNLKWVFGGVLKGGSGSFVSYQVVIDD